MDDRSHDASSSSGAQAPPPPSAAISADQFTQLLNTLGNGLAATQQATIQQLTTLTQTLQQGQSQGSSGYSAKPPTFHGDGVQNIDQFLAAFNRHADFFSWSPEKRFRALPLSLVGHANIWFSSLSPDSYRSFDDLTRLLREQYNSPASLWLARQQLNQRKMAANETVANYSADIRRQCQLLRISKPEWIHLFIQGLRPDIRDHLVLQQPQSFEQAEQMATLKEAISQPTSSSPADQQLVQALLAHLQPKPPAPAQTQQVAAFSTSFQDDTRSDEPVTMSSIRSLIQTELRRALAGNYSRADSRPSGTGYNGGRFDNRNRNRRTPDGHPICNTCNRRGHTSYNCRSLKQPQRDPRLPDHTRNEPNRRQPTHSSAAHQGNL